METEKKKLYIILYTIKKSFAENRQIFLFPVTAFVIYFALKEAFWGYAALVDPAGEVYSPFLEKYSLIQFIRSALIYPIKFILTLLGFDTYNTYDIIGIEYSSGVQILFPCLGVEMMIALVALIIAYPVKRKKIIFVILGIGAIHLLNIVRILGIIFVGHYFPGTGRIPLFHNYFNDIAYGIAFLFFYAWLSYVAPKEEKNRTF